MFLKEISNFQKVKIKTNSLEILKFSKNLMFYQNQNFKFEINS